MLDKRRLRRQWESRRPTQRASVFYGVYGLLSMIVFVAFILYSAGMGGNTNRYMGGIAMMIFFLGIFILVQGVHAAKDKQFNAVSRAVGVIFPAIATFLWICLYFMGMLLG